MSAYVDEINNIETEMKRLRKRLKELRGLKRKPAQALHRYMLAHNLTLYKCIKIEKVAPSPAKLPSKTPHPTIYV